MTLLNKLDRLVYATGVDRLIFMKMQPRNLRWTPLMVSVAAVAGYVLMARTRTPLVQEYWIGWLLFYGACIAAGFVRIFGPRFTDTEQHSLDERELLVKSRAHAISGMILATLVMFACFYMSTVGVPWLWHPRSSDWINLGFGIQAGCLLLPTWVASWLSPQLEPDDE